MIPLNVFILESPNFDDLAMDRTESTLTKKLVELMGWNVVSRRVTTLSHLESACYQFGQVQSNGRDFDIVLISAHGCPAGIGLTDGTLVGWDQLFPLFGEALAGKTVIMSSCSVLEDHSLRDCLEGMENHPLDLWGFRAPIDWPGAAVAVSMMLKTVHSNLQSPQANQHERTVRIMNTMAAIWQLYGLDVQAVRFMNQDSGAIKGRNIEFVSMPGNDGTLPVPSRFLGPAQVMAMSELAELGVSWETFQSVFLPQIESILGSLDEQISAEDAERVSAAFFETFEALKTEALQLASDATSK